MYDKIHYKLKKKINKKKKRMRLYYQGQDVMNIAILLIAMFSSEKVYFVSMRENPLEQMSQHESHIGF